MGEREQADVRPHIPESASMILARQPGGEGLPDSYLQRVFGEHKRGMGKQPNRDGVWQMAKADPNERVPSLHQPLKPTLPPQPMHWMPPFRRILTSAFIDFWSPLS
jgi:hypothetical protein